MKPINDRQAKTYPELLRFASKEDAAKVLKEWKTQLSKQPRFWVGLVCYSAGAGLALSLFLILLRQWIRFPSSTFGGIVGGVVGGSGAVAMTWFWRRQCRQFLRRELVARGIPICLKCGYDTRGLTDPRCPECGTAFDAALISGDRKP